MKCSSGKISKEFSVHYNPYFGVHPYSMDNTRRTLNTLLPVPLHRPTLNEDIPENLEGVRSYLKDFVKDYLDMRAVVQQNTGRMSQIKPEKPGNDPLDTLIGHSIFLDDQVSRPFTPAASTLKNGLSLANGTDRGKVNITFNYLGIGPWIVGSGASVTYTADLNVAGVNGRDTGTEAANTWYAVHMIVGPGADVLDTTANNLQPPNWRRGARVASLLSTSATAPTLPPGYTRFRRVGWVRNNGASDIYRFVNIGDFYEWNEDLTAADFQVLNVTTSSTTFTDVSLAKVVPPTSNMAHLCVNTFDTVSGALLVKNKNLANVVWSLLITNLINAAGASASVHNMCGTDSSQVVQYRSLATTNDATITVLGYYDPV